MERDPAGGEEDRPRHRVTVDVADEVRAGLPGDLKGAAWGGVRRSRRARLHADRAEADLAAGLQPGEMLGQVYARGGRGRAGLPVARGEDQWRPGRLGRLG